MSTLIELPVLMPEGVGGSIPGPGRWEWNPQLITFSRSDILRVEPHSEEISNIWVSTNKWGSAVNGQVDGHHPYMIDMPYSDLVSRLSVLKYEVPNEPTKRSD